MKLRTILAALGERKLSMWERVCIRISVPITFGLAVLHIVKDGGF